MKGYSFHPDLVLRSPRLPFSIAWPAIEAVRDPCFLEAVYLASPVLGDEIAKLSNHTAIPKKLQQSLLKYYLRSSTRCTPFGLFAGSGIAHWSADNDGVGLVADTMEKDTHFDIHYLSALSRHIATLPFVKKQLVYFPNNSAYRVGNELRYIEYVYENSNSRPQVASVDYSEYLERLLACAASGASIPSLESLLTVDDISAEEATAFIDELLASQVLVSEWQPSISGRHLLQQITGRLNKIHASNAEPALEKLVTILDQAATTLQVIDKRPVNHADEYRAIEALLQPLNIPFQRNKLFQTNSGKVSSQALVPAAIQYELSAALDVLHLICPGSHNAQLSAFKEKFIERYEAREVPIMEVMDTDTGLGYPVNMGDGPTPLTDDLVYPAAAAAETSVGWGVLEQVLNEKLTTAIQQNHFCIELKEEDLAAFTPPDANKLPASMSVVFRLVSGEQPLLLENASGSSAVNLLGRFAGSDKQIHAMAASIAAVEQEANPDIIFAEIVHLPGNSSANLQLHPPFRQYEIPYLASATVEKEFQIAITDLTIAVQKNQLVLRSKKHNRRIIPRLSTAHNYRKNALPLYHFLGDLQNHGKQSDLLFDWRALAMRSVFLPRVYYKKVILSRATWHFSKKHYHSLVNNNSPSFYEKMDVFRRQWQLPALIVLVEADNELLIDLDNAGAVEMLVNAIRNKSSVTIKEFLAPANAVKDNSENTYCNQFIAALVKKTPVYAGSDGVRETSVTRRFSPGSEWLYYKIFCSAATADKILTEAVLPLVTDLLAKGCISKFFFIRYSVPAFHIRLRLHVSDTLQLGTIIERVHEYTTVFEQQALLWNMELDTYQRELERYGARSIAQGESIFFYDSMAVLQMLAQTSGDAREQVRWVWVLRAIDSLLNNFNYSIDQKLSICAVLKNAYLAEFNADKTLKTQLTKKYNEHRGMIEHMLNPHNDPTNELKSLLDILEEKDRHIKPVVAELMALQDSKQLSVPIENLLKSYIHMLVNRATLARPRMHELVLYDMLYRYHFSQKARHAASGKQPGAISSGAL